ncbi:MAG: hypothetical protein ABIO76_01060 [Ginsengibacter sp.]
MKETSKDWLQNMNPNKVIGDAQRILKSAVDVLEEEIAAGILAAKKLENKVINVDEIRQENPEELMSRIRRDTHDAIDIILDAVTVIVNQFGTLTNTLTKVNQNGASIRKTNHIPVVKSEGVVKAGDNIEMPILLTNESKDKEMIFELNKADLNGPGGNKILARNIKLVPRLAVLSPSEKKEVAIKIKIPKSCSAGTYSGLFQDIKNVNVFTVVTIDVE